VAWVNTGQNAKVSMRFHAFRLDPFRLDLMPQLPWVETEGPGGEASPTDRERLSRINACFDDVKA
jgi:hypothetical protein